jgi:hypothetical protein
MSFFFLIVTGMFCLFKNKVYMNYVNKLCLSIATLVSFSCLGMIRQVIRDENGFRVFDGQQEHTVKPYFVDSLLKRMNLEQVQRFIERGNRIRVIRLSDGEYRLQAMVPVKGGGLFGASAGFWVGKIGVEVICHAAIWTTALIPGVGVGIATGLEASLAPIIEAASNTVAVGLGIAGGVATGPV